MVTDFSSEILKLSLVPFAVCQLPAWFNIAIVQETKSLKEYTYSCLISMFFLSCCRKLRALFTNSMRENTEIAKMHT